MNGLPGTGLKGESLCLCSTGSQRGVGNHNLGCLCICTLTLYIYTESEHMISIILFWGKIKMMTRSFHFRGYGMYDFCLHVNFYTIFLPQISCPVTCLWQKLRISLSAFSPFPSLSVCPTNKSHLSVKGVMTRRGVLPRYSYPYGNWAFTARWYKFSSSSQ